MTELLGFIGGILLAVCAMPQSWQCIKQGHADGLSPITVTLWFLGEVCLILYVLFKYQFTDPWLLLNYGSNLISVMIIFRYKFWRRNERNTRI